MNVDADAGAKVDNLSDMGDAIGIGDVDNNIDNKNTYAKADFSIYNVAGVNAGASADDISVINEEVGNNINNTDINQSSKLGVANKDELGETAKGGIDETKIKTGIRLGEANKNGTSGVNSEANNKASGGSITGTDNSTKSGNEKTD